MNHKIGNRTLGFRAPVSFHEKVMDFCREHDLTPSQVFRKATVTYINSFDGRDISVQPSSNVNSR